MKLLFTLIYRVENEYGQYWGNNTNTVKVYGSNFAEAEEKLDKIAPAGWGKRNHILHWEAEEVLDKLKDSDIK